VKKLPIASNPHMQQVRFGTTMFRIERTLTRHRFQEIASFIDHSRHGMAAMWKQFSARFDKVTAGLTEEAKAEYIDHVYDDISMLRDESPQLLRHAQCMLIYGAFEKRMASLCRAIHSDGKITSPPRDNTYMGDAKGYLCPHIRTRPQPFGTDWEWMDEFRIIRNWMAHNGGKVQKNTKPNGNWVKANKFVRRNRGLIKFERFDEIVVNDKFVDRAVEKATRAIRRIEEAVQCLYV
jgi:hypothetical protein